MATIRDFRSEQRTVVYTAVVEKKWGKREERGGGEVKWGGGVWGCWDLKTGISSKQVQSNSVN